MTDRRSILAALRARRALVADDALLGEADLERPSLPEIRLRGQPILLHRSLWRDAITVGIAREDWQMRFLPHREAALLEMLDAEGTVVIDADLAARLDASQAHLGRELEARFLVQRAPQPMGPPRKLVSWRRWAEERDPRLTPHPPPRLPECYDRLDAAANAIEPRARVPWRRGGIRDRRWD